jgi:tripartite-type tricarboxylate transporter receptor subunit TctC
VAPPKTPEDVMTILRDAFAKVAQDQELKEDSKKLMMSIEYTPADECLKALNYVFNQPEDVVKEMSKYLKF